MNNYILAHDLGTTGNKATLYDKEGKLIGSAFSGYKTVYAHPGWAEQDPADWWRAVCESTQQLLVKSQIGGDQVAGLTFSGQMMGCVPLARSGQPLRSAIIWADVRAVDQVAKIAESISPEDVYAITGHRLSSSYTLAKMLWIRDHQPEVYDATHKFVHAKDAMIARLTGQFVTDPSDASGMNLYDLEKGLWSERIARAAGIDLNQLPKVVPSTHVVSGVLPSVAGELGLPAGTPVVMGGGDGSCAAVGAGVIEDGNAYTYLGSSAWIAIATPKPIYDPMQRTFTFAHVIPETYMPIGTMQAAGASYQWARDQFCELECQEAVRTGESPYKAMDALAESVPAGANGLVYLPYLMGERSPRWNPDARGAFMGLTIRHTRAHMLRAMLEGITLNLNVILGALSQQGAEINAMRLIGGGAQSSLWNQIMADIYGMPIQRLAILEEATSMGAAVVGGVGIGLYPDFSIAAQMNEISGEVMPQSPKQTAYRELAPLFERAYQSIEPLFDELRQLEDAALC